MARNILTTIRSRSMAVVTLMALNAMSTGIMPGRAEPMAGAPPSSREPSVQHTGLGGYAVQAVVRAARSIAAWLIAPMVGPDGEMNWKALLWSNGRSRW